MASGLTNKEFVGRSLDLVRIALVRFVREVLERRYGEEWEQVARSAAFHDKSKGYGDRDKAFDEFCVAQLLAIISIEWPRSFRRQFGWRRAESVKGWILELRNGRKDWAHNGSSKPGADAVSGLAGASAWAHDCFSIPEASRILDTVAKLCREIGAPEAENAESLLADFVRDRFGAGQAHETPASGAGEGRGRGDSLGSAPTKSPTVRPFAPEPVAVQPGIDAPQHAERGEDHTQSAAKGASSGSISEALSQDDEFRSAIRMFPHVSRALIGASVCVLAVAVGLMVAWREAPTRPGNNAVASLPVRSQFSPVGAAGVASDVESAARASVNAVLDRARRAERKWIDLTNEIAHYEDKYKPLLENELGRRIALDPDGVETLAILLAKPRISQEDARRMLERIRADQVVPLAAMLQHEPVGQPDPARIAQIDQVTSAAEGELACYRELTAQFKALADKARNSTQSAELTLAGAIEAIEHRHTIEKESAIVSAAALARAEAAQRLASAEREKIQAEAAVAEQEKQRQAQAKQLEAKAIADAKQRDRLMRLSRDPSVIAIYSQFLTPGHVSFRISKGISSVRDDIAKPLSYSELSRTGVLADWQIFAHLGARQDYTYGNGNTGFLTFGFSSNDRPGNWGYPSTAEEQKEIQARLKLFNQLAPFWIQDGRLSP